MLSLRDTQSLASAVEKITSRHKRRNDFKSMEVFSVAEYEDVELPAEMFSSAGGLEISPDVQKRIDIRYKASTDKFLLRSDGWVGFIPLNNKFALQVTTRVPIENIEKVLACAEVDAFEPLSSTRFYSVSSEPVETFLDIVTDGFLETLEEIRHLGRFKPYRNATEINGFPRGKINARATAFISQKAQRPVAVSSSFQRSNDHAIHDLFISALVKLHRKYQAKPSHGRLNSVIGELRKHEVSGVEQPNTLSVNAMSNLLLKATNRRQEYAKAISLALLIVSGQSLALRGGSTGEVETTSILLDMALAFESFARDELRRALASTDCEVLDGNKGAPEGARLPLYVDEPNGPSTSPDIVVRRGGEVVIVIDVKYKKPKARIDRADVNQAICYGDVYGCKNIAILYPAENATASSAECIGNVGTHSLHRLKIDLGADDMQISIKSCADYIKSL